MFIRLPFWVSGRKGKGVAFNFRQSKKQNSKKIPHSFLNGFLNSANGLISTIYGRLNRNFSQLSSGISFATLSEYEKNISILNPLQPCIYILYQ